MSILNHNNQIYFQNSLNSYLNKLNESYPQNKPIEDKNPEENKEVSQKAEWVRIGNRLVYRLISED